MKFTATIKNGRLVLHDNKGFGRYIKDIDGDVWIDIKPAPKARSSQQNSYYRHIIRQIGNHLGYNEDEMHYVIKQKFEITSTKDLDGIDVCEFVFGDEAGHNNKITYQLKGEIKKENIKIRYNSDMLKIILNANKDVDEGVFKISKEGLMYLAFQNEEIESEYYMVPQEDGVL